MNPGLLSLPMRPPYYRLDVFASSGVWVKPWWAKMVYVQGIGGGGGGGSGAVRATSGTLNRYGGGGGAGGLYSRRILDAAVIPTEVVVTIGTGGTGGASVVTSDSAGLAGSPGSNTTFDAFLLCLGGPGAYAVDLTALYGNLTAPQRVGWMGGQGALASDALYANYAFAGGTSGTGGGGGGAGSCRNTTGATARDSSPGGAVAYIHPTLGGTGGGAYRSPANPALAGGDGTSVDTSIVCCGGGGGGGGGAGLTTGTAGGNGGAGGFPGGGGGGGAWGPNGASSGAGGAGANGVLWVQSFGYYLPELL